MNKKITIKTQTSEFKITKKRAIMYLREQEREMKEGKKGLLAIHRPNLKHTRHYNGRGYGEE